MNVLVIEDNPSDFKLLDVVLTASGHKVRRTRAFVDTLAAVRQEAPQVILIDLTLPDVDGLTLIRMLRTDADTHAIPIVAMTAYPDMWSRDGARSAGCNAYLVKPLDTRSLTRELAAVVAGNEDRQH